MSHSSSSTASAASATLSTIVIQARAHLASPSGSASTLVEEVLQRMGIQIAALQARSLAELGVPLLAQDELLALEPDFSVMPYSQCLARQLVLIRLPQGWRCCLADPWQLAHSTQVANLVGSLPEICWADAKDIERLLKRHADKARALASVEGTQQNSRAEEEPEINLETIEQTVNPVVRFIDAALLDGWHSGASDIHFETSRSAIGLKYRLDGVLVETGRFSDASRIEEVLNRIKIMAELDISEQRVPQDGRFRARFKERHVDFRVSIMPSIHGEDAVIRILDKSHLDQTGSGISLQALGFAADTQEVIRRHASEPQGMLLVTGPTGSGKTTTLYAVLSETRSALEKIVTIEDPVEYELPGILQIPVNEKKGLTFSRGLRSILRHDPDRLLVGEIRDPETAEIAVQAALTGHGVLTSLHANNAFDAVNRFVHMGVDLYAFASAINALISQRLMRRVCPVCAQNQAISPGLQALLHAEGLDSSHATLRRGMGCEQCRMTGYQGRFAVSEVLALDDHFRQLIIDRAPIPALKEAVAQRGIVSLRHHALHAVLSGQTTEEEFRRVVAAQ